MTKHKRVVLLYELGMKQVRMTKFQCSKATEAAAIKKRADRALEQAKLFPNEMSLLFLDEVSLAEGSEKRPLKVKPFEPSLI